MRYKERLLNEITKSDIFKIVNDFEDRLLPIVGREFAKKNWNLSDQQAINIINKHISDKVILTRAEDFGPRVISASKYIIAAFLMIEMSSTVLIVPAPGFSKYFRRYSLPGEADKFNNVKDNEVFRELSKTLAHELIHIRQVKLSKGKSLSILNVGNEKKYFSNTHEIEAFAHDAAIEILRYDGESETYTMYLNIFGKSDKTFKRFAKKLIGFLIQLSETG